MNSSHLHLIAEGSAILKEFTLGFLEMRRKLSGRLPAESRHLFEQDAKYELIFDGQNRPMLLSQIGNIFWVADLQAEHDSQQPDRSLHLEQ